jgi:anti-sigma regulatory factor (Ser/Thr protein kinase)
MCATPAFGALTIAAEHRRLTLGFRRVTLEHLQKRLLCKSESAAAARGMLRQFSAPLGGADLAAASLVLTELVTNAIRHGCDGSDDEIDIRLSRSNSLLRMEVSQTGPLYDPDEVRKRRPGETRGWGVLLMDRMSSSWGIGASGSHVWAELKLEA